MLFVRSCVYQYHQNIQFLITSGKNSCKPPSFACLVPAEEASSMGITLFCQYAVFWVMLEWKTKRKRNIINNSWAYATTIQSHTKTIFHHVSHTPTRYASLNMHAWRLSLSLACIIFPHKSTTLGSQLVQQKEECNDGALPVILWVNVWF